MNLFQQTLEQTQLFLSYGRCFLSSYACSVQLVSLTSAATTSWTNCTQAESTSYVQRKVASSRHHVNTNIKLPVYFCCFVVFFK
ncbi:hypothetical protein ANCCAN_24563 [Ancylostoma caninum]|uniref:Uncharacterized protein n=1 Tax=Ancylostoma caninum TaxID=29170 RepID=A0A368FFS1_ANCCA|nr:hypothetical protein ANCCAN_24563 [Ancylostoma caninum]